MLSTNRTRSQRWLCAVPTAVMLIAVTAVTIPVAQSRIGGAPLNGKYLVTSNGDWATTNDVYHDETTVRQVWTITSSCVDSANCAGQVSSSAGWSAEIRNTDGSSWVLNREVPDWEPCPDGTTAPGEQSYRFWGVDASAQPDDSSTTLLAGNDRTMSQSGACGKNQPLVIELPARLQRIDQ